MSPIRKNILQLFHHLAPRGILRSRPDQVFLHSAVIFILTAGLARPLVYWVARCALMTSAGQLG